MGLKCKSPSRIPECSKMEPELTRRCFFVSLAASLEAAGLASCLAPTCSFGFADDRAGALAPRAAWRSDGDDYHFETELVSGRYLTAGKYQGMRSVVHRPTSVEIAAGEKLPGLVCPYRVFGNGRRFGDVRDRPTKVDVTPEGLRIVHPADAENPFDIVSTYSWIADTLDIHYAVTVHTDMRGFELGVASYLAPGFRAFISRQSNHWGKTESQIVPVDVNPMTDLYALFPRNEAAIRTVFDGRWDLPPAPVRYTVPAYFAQALAYRRHVTSGVMAVGMADPKECFAICVPVNNPPEAPDPAKGYQALYFYLFGRDLKKGETASTRARWVVGQDLEEHEILARWESFAGA
jgi:hypothetical protein